MKTYCFALDLHNDPALIAEYKRWHQLDTIWPEVLQQAKAPGVLSTEIYHAGDRLMLILTTSDDFSLKAKAACDAANPTMQRWEEFMWEFQKPLPFAEPGQKWVLMEKIFDAR
jgi:L-rhamnose mutarotase